MPHLDFSRFDIARPKDLLGKCESFFWFNPIDEFAIVGYVITQMDDNAIE